MQFKLELFARNVSATPSSLTDEGMDGEGQYLLRRCRGVKSLWLRFQRFCRNLKRRDITPQSPYISCHKGGQYSKEWFWHNGKCKTTDAASEPRHQETVRNYRIYQNISITLVNASPFRDNMELLRGRWTLHLNLAIRRRRGITASLH